MLDSESVGPPQRSLAPVDGLEQACLSSVFELVAGRPLCAPGEESAQLVLGSLLDAYGAGGPDGHSEADRPVVDASESTRSLTEFLVAEGAERRSVGHVFPAMLAKEAAKLCLDAVAALSFGTLASGGHREAEVLGPYRTRVGRTEQPGKWFHPLIATLVAAAGRLLLASAMRQVADRGGHYALCDTDSLFIVAIQHAGLVPARRRSRP